MIMRVAEKHNLQSTSRQNATKFLFLISTTYPRSTGAGASSCLDFFFLLFAHDSCCRSRPSLHLHLTTCWHIWPLIGQMLLLSIRTATCAVSAKSLPAPYGGAHTLHIWRECREWSPPWIVGPLAQCMFCMQGGAALVEATAITANVLQTHNWRKVTNKKISIKWCKSRLWKCCRPVRWA